MRRLVPQALEHTGTKAFDEHLLGAEAVVRAWMPDDRDMHRAALFHSIYGTEGFQGFALPFDQRPAIRSLIGARAERLAWLFCVVDRASFDRGVLGSDDLSKARVSEPGEPKRLEVAARPELGAFSLKLTEPEFLDLCALFLADFLEQIEGVVGKTLPHYEWLPGDGWKYRRHAYRAMAVILARERGLPVAMEAHDHVYALEPEGTRGDCIPALPPITDAAKAARACIASREL